MTACPVCTGENADDARFCSHCGRPLAAADTGGKAERRLVTVLFADITGSTPLGEELDPEDLTDVLSAYATAMREEIEAEGGTVEKFIGDAVMAAFGVPVAHEDDPSRALRAALRMRRRLGELNVDLERLFGVRLEMRTGVNTGDVVVSPDAGPEIGMVTGDAVNAAARLEQTADPGQVLVSQRTARSARGFRFEEVGALDLRGKSRPVATVELVDEGLDELPGEPQRGVPGLRAPMVGRDHELDLLRSTYGRLASSGRAQLVTIYGDPGIGKSRLTRELLAWAEEEGAAPAVLKGRCLPYGEAVTYWPLAEILKTHTGVLDSDSPEAALAKIGGLAQDVLSAVPDPARSAAVLAFTFGLEDRRFGLADLPPRQVRLETHEAWRAFFTGLTADRPAIVVIEDIHWADEPLLDLLEELADRVAGPLLFVCPSRPDLAQRRTAWGGGKRNFSAIFLEPLSHEDAASLVENLLAVEELPDETREAMLARADGNPLFLEEIVRHLIDEGRIVRDGSHWRATEDVVEIVIPDTVQAVLAARIDLLPPVERRALLSASVVGRVFWTGSVTRLLDDGAETDDVLARLEDRELVLSQVGSRIAGEREFLFKHVLTRDVAYGTLARRDRARAHADVAGWIESAAGERQREFADLLAHHLAQAYEGSLTDPGVPDERREVLRHKSLTAGLAASAEARSKMLLDRANEFAEGALALAGDAHERSLALEALGLCALWDFRGDDAWRNLSQAVDERVAGGRESGEVLAMLCARAVEPPTRWPASLVLPPDEDEVAPYVEIGLEHAAPVGEARVRLLLARSMWVFAFGRGGFTDDEAAASRQAGEDAFALAEALGRDDLASAALDGVGSIEVIVGLHGHTWPVIERRLEIAERLTDPWEVGDALQTAADIALAIGRYDDARRLATEGYERARGGPDVWRAGLAWRAIARFKLGDWDGAVEDFERMEAARATTRFGTVGYFTLTMWSCIALLNELRGEGAAADALVARVDAELSGGTPTVRTIPWLARLSAHRRSDEAFERIEGSASLVGRDMGRGATLEAHCDVIGDLGRWELADEIVAEAREFAQQALLEALPLHADRLDGRSALARGDASSAVEALARAAFGFADLGARWEAALARLWLGEAQLEAGMPDARESAQAAHDVFEELRSLQELERARSLLGRIG
jgi:class 3 adenylate cyclase